MANVTLIVLIIEMDKFVTFATAVIVPDIEVSDVRCRKMKGSKDSFDIIYEQNRQRIIFFADSYVNDPDKAEDIAHDVFIALWNNIEKIDSGAEVAYLYASARNMCLNYLKHKVIAKKYNDKTLAAKTSWLNAAALEEDDSSVIFEKDIKERVAKGMDMMSDKVRRTFMLSRIKGMKNREIAKAEGVAESTVEARITSALLVMKKVLKDYLK